MFNQKIRTSLRKLAVGTVAIAALGTAGGGVLSTVSAGAAHAGTSANYVTQDDFGDVRYVGGNEANNVTVTIANGVYTIKDLNADLTTFSPCTRVSFGTVTCRVIVSTARVHIDTLAGNDTVHGSSAGDIIKAGDGNDTVYGGASADDIDGGNGADQLYGEAGNDKLDGGVSPADFGTDLVGVDRGDYISGGSGVDWTTYINKLAGVRVTLDNVANDGVAAQSENDNVLNDVEDVTGTWYNDNLTGSASNNHLYGTNGDDVLYGLAGNDSLYGEKGRDAAYGGDGNDTLWMRHATTTSTDIDAAISGGAGIDIAHRDNSDVTPTGCEDIRLS
jgi:Ca2+-binding RTX toxin-like protein